MLFIHRCKQRFINKESTSYRKITVEMNKNIDEIPWDINNKKTMNKSVAHMLSPIPLPPLDTMTNSVKKLVEEQEFPFLEVNGEIAFPRLAYPLAIKDADVYQAIKTSKEDPTPKYIVIGSRKHQTNAIASLDDIFKYGILCEVARLVEFSAENDATPAIMVCGLARVEITSFRKTKPVDLVNITLSEEILPRSKKSAEFVALIQTLQELTINFIETSVENFPNNMLQPFRETDDPRFIVNFSSSILPLKDTYKQELLSITHLKERAMKTIVYLQEALEMQNLKNKIRSKTREEIDQQQKEYFLTQQIRMIQQELGRDDNGNPDIEEFETAANKKKWSADVRAVFDKELKKLSHLNPQSPDYAIQYQYLETLLDLPWNESTVDNLDLNNAQKVLDHDHYGLDKIKERIIEHLAVIKLRGDMKSPILCLWGPPGVGKTSLGKSIADALGRKYVRISLGGVHDEAEIRGHRRTYIGAMPGRIIQSIKRAGSSNPVVVLDEIDKIDSDYKGDPSSALLEVLDPEQNKTFHDNYIDIDYDLSNVLFIATANTLNTISHPLLDRMELIQVSGYIVEEKIEIATRHLVPKQLNEHGLTADRLSFPADVLRMIIEGYTRESGVRQLEKNIASICRKVARKIAAEEWGPGKKRITKKEVKEFLGVDKFTPEEYIKGNYCGVVTGLAWTSVGGEILYIETSIHKGKEGQMTLTGNLGNVMKESASIALDYIRAHMHDFNLEEDLFKDIALHLHVPEGAIPKDGPSAGITMVTSILSALSKRMVKPRIAMTGEMTLRGRVLPVGGIKEKILAAKRAGITDIILSEENKKNIEEIQEIYVQGLTFHYVKDIHEVIDLALVPDKKPAPRRKSRQQSTNSK